MADIKQQLVLNKHPKDVPNLAMIDANNIKISHDESSICNDDGIKIIQSISDAINSFYTKLDGSEVIDWRIVGVIPCNNELIIFAASKTICGFVIESGEQKELNYEYYPCQIFRYNTKQDKCSVALGSNIYNNNRFPRFQYFGGRIKGTFTYNVENHLILAVSEYDSTTGNDLHPLYTIDLGTMTENWKSNENGNYNSGFYTFPACPEVIIPRLKYHFYTKQQSYKGWYNFYIRFKITNNNYTQWFPFGYPIYNDELTRQNIQKYVANAKPNYNNDLVDLSKTNGVLFGCSDYFSLDNEIVNKGLRLNIEKIEKYDYFQLGFTITTKNSTKCFRTNDIQSRHDDFSIFLDIKHCVEISLSELTSSFYNYYNVKNVINYKNRLYISNYKEKENDEVILQEYANNIVGKIYQNRVTYSDDSLIYDHIISSTDLSGNTFQKDGQTKIEIPLYEYLDIDENAIISIDTGEKGGANFNVTDNKNTKIMCTGIIEITMGADRTFYSDNQGANLYCKDLIINQNDKQGEYCNGKIIFASGTTFDFVFNNSVHTDAILTQEIVLFGYYFKKISDKKFVIGNAEVTGNFLVKGTNYNNRTIHFKNDMTSITASQVFNTQEECDEFYNINAKLAYENVSIKDFTISTREETNTVPSQIFLKWVGVEDGKLTTKLYSNATIYYNNQKFTFYSESNNVKRILQNYKIFINSNRTFENRLRNFTLIPGEVYNFFIHYVDKYGIATNGYRIPNKLSFVYQGDEYFPIDISNSNTAIPKPNNSAFCVKLNDNILKYNDNSKGYELNLDNLKLLVFSETIPSDLYFIAEREETIDDDQLSAITEYLQNQLGFFVTDSNTFYGKKYYEILENDIPATLTIDKLCNNIFINNDGDRLFKVPMPKNNFKNYNNNGVEHAPSFSLVDKVLRHIEIDFENIEIPNGYIGYFFSYEKLEPIRKYTGLLTKNDFRALDYVTENYSSRYENGVLVGIYPTVKSSASEQGRRSTKNTKESNTIYFYSSDLTIQDNISLDLNVMRIESENCFDVYDIPNWDMWIPASSCNFPTNLNKPQDKYENYDIKYLPLNKVNYRTANSSNDGRFGIGSCLEIEGNYGLFPTYETIVIGDTAEYEKTYGNIKLYKVSLLNITRELYTNKNKQLIKFTNIFYDTEDKKITNDTSKITDNGYNGVLNGRYTFDGNLIYENAGTITDEGLGIIYRVQNNLKWYTDITDGTHLYNYFIPFVAYVQNIDCNNFFHESKVFNNAPRSYQYQTGTAGSESGQRIPYNLGCLVSPADSLDLFKNPQLSFDDAITKYFTNYNETLINAVEYNKTVRRSNVIQDESKEITWRYFPVEGYKNINENKGNITNLIGVGNILLVHTEHSMYIFDIDNNLITADKNIQLYQPDSFEVAYKEVFTSELGFGGLQDSDAWLLDSFGYIYYNNDFNRICSYDNNQIEYIDKDIIEWLYKYKPTKARFANDKRNNRIFIEFTLNTGQIFVLSYNIATKTFISFHDFRYDFGYNDKTDCFLLCDEDKHNKCSIHKFNTIDCCKFDNGFDSIGIDKTYESSVSIIINDNYEQIKYLEYIIYKLFKYTNKEVQDYQKLPVEEEKYPFSGDYIQVFNNLVDTGKLDINISQEDAKNIFGEFTKPYWNLGTWDFSYLRDIKNGQNVADLMSRIYGNYFIIKFTFTNQDNLRVEFESINCSITKDKRI